MRQRGKRVLAVLAAMALLCGCGAKDTGKDTSASVKAETGETEGSQQADTAAEGEGETYMDYSSGFEKTVTIQIPVYDRAFANWNTTDNYYTRWVQKEFGDKYNIKVEYVAISKPNQVTDYMQLLAAGKAPDIIFHYDMPQALAYYGEGAMQKLDLDEIKYYAPTYWEKMDDTVLKYGKVEGDPYFFFADRPKAYNVVTLIRQDWIDQVGKEMPQSMEELNELFQAWKDAGLGNGGGWLEQNSYINDYPFRDWPQDEKQRALYSDLSVAALPSQAEHDYLKNMNYQYNHALIDREFYLNIDEPSKQADFISGAAGVYYSFSMGGSTTLFDSLKKNCPGAEVSVLPRAALTPEGHKPQERAYWPFGLIMGINHDTTDEERAAVWMYFEWLSQPENLLFMQNGPEGETFEMKDGLPMKIAGYEGEAKLSENDNKDYWCLLTEGIQYDDPELEIKAAIQNGAPAGYEYLIEQSYADFESRKEYSTTDPLFTTIISSVAEYKADLNEKWKELHVKCVMAPEDQFEATYEAACQDYLDSGYQAILDEKQAAIDAGLYSYEN